MKRSIGSVVLLCTSIPTLLLLAVGAREVGAAPPQVTWQQQSVTINWSAIPQGAGYDANESWAALGYTTIETPANVVNSVDISWMLTGSVRVRAENTNAANTPTIYFGKNAVQSSSNPLNIPMQTLPFFGIESAITPGSAAQSMFYSDGLFFGSHSKSLAVYDGTTDYSGISGTDLTLRGSHPVTGGASSGTLTITRTSHPGFFNLLDFARLNSIQHCYLLTTGAVRVHIFQDPVPTGTSYPYGDGVLIPYGAGTGSEPKGQYVIDLHFQ